MEDTVQNSAVSPTEWRGEVLSKSAAKKCEERKESDYSDLGMAQTCEFSKTICLTIPTLYVSFKGVQDTKMIEKA